jgi:hypothetical protein
MWRWGGGRGGLRVEASVCPWSMCLTCCVLHPLPDSPSRQHRWQRLGQGRGQGRRQGRLGGLVGFTPAIRRLYRQASITTQTANILPTCHSTVPYSPASQHFDIPACQLTHQPVCLPTFRASPFDQHIDLQTYRPQDSPTYQPTNLPLRRGALPDAGHELGC